MAKENALVLKPNLPYRLIPFTRARDQENKPEREALFQPGSYFVCFSE